jgi:hypothetical protein
MGFFYLMRGAVALLERLNDGEELFLLCCTQRIIHAFQILQKDLLAQRRQKMSIKVKGEQGHY